MMRRPAGRGRRWLRNIAVLVILYHLLQLIAQSQTALMVMWLSAFLLPLVVFVASRIAGFGTTARKNRQ